MLLVGRSVVHPRGPVDDVERKRQEILKQGR